MGLFFFVLCYVFFGLFCIGLFCMGLFCTDTVTGYMDGLSGRKLQKKIAKSHFLSWDLMCFESEC